MYLHLLCSYLIACTSTDSAFLLSTYTSTAPALSLSLTLVSTLFYTITCTSTVSAFTLSLKLAQNGLYSGVCALIPCCPGAVWPRCSQSGEVSVHAFVQISEYGKLVTEILSRLECHLPSVHHYPQFTGR